ncbi:hypothetical protein RN001_009451 [Aquatica leii]|uniref:AXH domain-containing protein n=1 Tax=Aquatica leii TaxID=1421715 RepID=A0AAN7SPY1_9COLE|nr:hypothetical protein RN001_009451 [Aquatica leii]
MVVVVNEPIAETEPILDVAGGSSDDLHFKTKSNSYAKEAYKNIASSMKAGPLQIKSPLTGVELLLTAVRLQNMPLAKQCIENLDQQLDKSNVLLIISSLSKCKMPSNTKSEFEPSAPPIIENEHQRGTDWVLELTDPLRHNCLLEIDKNADYILKQKEIFDLSYLDILSIVERNTLQVTDELLVYSAIYRWAIAECHRRTLNTHLLNIRAVLRQLSYMPRYGLMAKNKFMCRCVDNVKGPSRSGLLEEKEWRLIKFYIQEKSRINFFAFFEIKTVVLISVDVIISITNGTILRGQQQELQQKEGPRQNVKPMISAGIEGRLPYMTYPEPWGGPPKQHPEFLRPAPKPLPPNRYNGVTISTSLNGTRLGPPQRPPSKYPSPPATTPVNLTQPKEDATEELSYPVYSRLLPPPPPFMYHHTGPYAPLYQPPYTPPLRANYPQPPPLSPLEPPYTPTTPSATGAAIFLSPSATFSPPAIIQQQASQTASRIERKPSPSFKVPSGKEGSLKHRILTRPGDSALLARNSIDQQKEGPRLSETTRKRLTATVSPPRSPAKAGNNNVVPVGNFTKGSLIQLANGELRRVEDMRTEDFVNSAERSPELRLADSTVVRIEENPITGTGTVTLSYNQRRTQVEFEASLEHPFFVYGQGWASCAPDRTLQTYGLKVHRLQVGDILISLTPRESTTTSSTRGSTIITTATTTAVTSRQVSAESTVHSYHLVNPSQNLPNSLTASGVNYHPNVSSQHNNTISPDCSNSKKRRWSAPDQICDENEQNVRKVKT